MESSPAPTVSGSLVFVSSPSARCGTTLVQRLLNSSPDLLVLGEGVGAALIELVRSLAAKARVLARAEVHRRDLERALSGEQFWCPHLLGDAPGFVGLFAEALERFVRFHERVAQSHGRSRWGAKLPTVPVEALRELRATLPESRLVYVVRGVVSAARSAKARRFLKTPEDLERFAVCWREGVVGIQGLRADPNVLVLDHEELERRGTALLPELERFTGARGLDPRVLFARVNTWTGPGEEGKAPDQYLAPGELTEEELAILERVMRASITGSESVELAPARRPGR